MAVACNRQYDVNVNGFCIKSCVASTVVASLLSVASGCASSQQASAPTGVAPDAAPADFQIDLTVLSGDPDEGNRPADERTARYVLYPGGDLYHAASPDLTAADMPGFVQTLDAATMQLVWEAAARPVFESREDRPPIGNVELVDKQNGQLTHIVSIVAGGERALFGLTRSVDAPADPAIQRLTRTLAMLAFASDRPDESVLRIPRRYDFGPDPYARYRDNTSVEGERP